MIGIIGAMEVEVQQLRLLMDDVSVKKISGIDFYQGTLHDLPVVLAKCGVGKVFAAVCAEIMALEFKVDRMVNIGVAGTLSPDLHIGDIAIAKAFVQHDMDTSAVGDPVGLISGINIIELPTDPAMVESLEKICRKFELNLKTGVVATGDQFICSQDRKHQIVDRFGAVAAEMEGGAIAQVCYINKIPFAAFRVISDEADGHATIDYPTFVQKAADTSTSLMEALTTQI